MAECPVCFGEGAHDMRDDDALFGEHFTDEQLNAMRGDGMVHPCGVVQCSECEGTGTITEERRLDLAAGARAFVDQVIAKAAEEGLA